MRKFTHLPTSIAQEYRTLFPPQHPKSIGNMMLAPSPLSNADVRPLLQCMLLLLLSCCFLSGCKNQHDDPHKNVARADVLAKVGDSIISISDFQQALKRQSPYFRTRYLSLARKKDFLRNLVQFELMLLEAKRKQLDKHPRVQEYRRRAMIQLLIRRILKKVEIFQISETETKAAYQKHIREFQRSERRRVRQIVVRVPEHSSPQIWAAKSVLALRIFDEVRRFGTSPLYFLSMVEKYSEDIYSQKRGGDIGYGVRTQLGGKWEISFSDAVFQIKKVGDIAGPIKTSWGFHIVRLEEIVPPVNKPLSLVREALRRRILKQKREALYDNALKKLRKRFKVQITSGWLARLKLPASSPQTTKRSPSQIQNPKEPDVPGVENKKVPAKAPHSLPSRAVLRLPPRKPASRVVKPAPRVVKPVPRVVKQPTTRVVKPSVRPTPPPLPVRRRAAIKKKVGSPASVRRVPTTLRATSKPVLPRK